MTEAPRGIVTLSCGPAARMRSPSKTRVAFSMGSAPVPSMSRAPVMATGPSQVGCGLVGLVMCYLQKIKGYSPPIGRGRQRPYACVAKSGDDYRLPILPENEVETQRM